MDSFQKKVFILFMIVVFDSILTVFLVVNGWGELNPIMHWYMTMTSISWMAITKIVGTLILLFILSKLDEARRHIEWAIPVYIFLLAGGLMFQFAWNVIRRVI